MPLRTVSPQSVITGWDFSTSGVKCLAFDLEGKTLAEVRLPTDLWTKGGVSEINLMQLEGQARASVRALAAKLRELGRLQDWVAGGISATHHTAGRIDQDHNQVRRAICWNDQTLAKYHERGLDRLGGQAKVRELIGGPWAVRYSLSHLVKDEAKLSPQAWQRTRRILLHGPLAAGYLTGNFDVTSVSSAASTGLMDLRTGQWCEGMLGALKHEENRKLAWQQLPRIVDASEPIGALAPALAMEAGLDMVHRPLLFPTSDDQQAGLVGGGAVDAGQIAIILGTSAVVNASSATLPATDQLDAMRLNWGPYLWMRCYNNGAYFLNEIVGENPDWAELEAAARACPPGSKGTTVLPFVHAEPSLGIDRKLFGWEPKEPKHPGRKFRAALEALAYLIALGVRQHEEAGQKITRISVSGGMARNSLMCEILASVLDKPLELLQSDEGPALGAAVTALAALENYQARQKGDAPSYTVADAVAQMVKFRTPVQPVAEWRGAYEKGLAKFEKRIRSRRKVRRDEPQGVSPESEAALASFLQGVTSPGLPRRATVRASTALLPRWPEQLSGRLSRAAALVRRPVGSTRARCAPKAPKRSASSPRSLGQGGARRPGSSARSCPPAASPGPQDTRPGRPSSHRNTAETGGRPRFRRKGPRWSSSLLRAARATPCGLVPAAPEPRPRRRHRTGS